MSRLSTCLISVLCLLVILTGQISGLLWRPPPQTYPSDPADSFYQAFQAVPSTSVTAHKFMASFLGISYSRITKRSNSKEDIVAVIDGSGSIGRCEFDEGKMALVNVMGKMNDPMFDTKYAAVTYSSSAKVNFKFSPRSTAASKIKKIVYPGGSSNTEAGLAEAKKLLFEDPLSGPRHGSKKVVLLITDGQSNNKNSTISMAQKLKSKGATIYVVAVGDHIYGIDEMVKVASDPYQHILRVETLRKFYEVTRLILKKGFPKQPLGPYNPPCSYGK